MPRKVRQLKAEMRKAGARMMGEEGDHEKWRHPLVRDFQVELAGADGDDAKPYQERDVRKLIGRIDEEKDKQQKQKGH